MSWHGMFANARSFLTSVSTDSDLANGFLTPDEFVVAGEQLVSTCPTWRWGHGSTHAHSYLPKDKQYLVTKNVPCESRVAEVMKDFAEEVVQEGDDEWVLTHTDRPEEDNDIGDAEDEVQDMEEESAPAVPAGPEEDEMSEESDADILDIDDLGDDLVGLEEDPSSAGSGNVLKVRTYDLYITYDKYYRTPRVWLCGYSAGGVALSSQEMFQDMMPEYVKKTVTVENFPHQISSGSLQLPAIHPCKHAHVMASLMTKIAEARGIPQDEAFPVEGYMFLFLKFISSVIPTVDYDFTITV